MSLREERLVRGKLGRARRMRPGRPDDALAHPHDDRALPAATSAEIGLTAAHQPQIDLGEQLRVQQRAVTGARGGIDVEAPAQRIQAVGRAREALPREQQGIDMLAVERPAGRRGAARG